MTFYNNSKQNGFENLYFFMANCEDPDKTSSQMGNDPSPGSQHLFGDTIINDAQRQVTLNLKQ